MRRAYVAIGAVVVIAGIVAMVLILAPLATRSMDTTGTTITNANQIAGLSLAYVAPPYEDDYGVLRVSGYVDNRSSQTIGQANVLIQLYDSSGNRSAQIKYTIPDIPPRQRRTYDTSAGTFKGARTAQIKILSLVVK